MQRRGTKRGNQRNWAIASLVREEVTRRCWVRATEWMVSITQVESGGGEGADFSRPKTDRRLAGRTGVAEARGSGRVQ